MKCPKCFNEMETVEFEMIDVDRCLSCKGIWFKDLDHEALKALKGSEAIDTGDPETGKKFNVIDRIDCPTCKTRMIRMVDKDQPHIWFEHCTMCSGSFFDAGEFKDFKEKTLSDFFKDLLTKPRQ